MNIFFINVNVSHRNVTSTLFSELLSCLPFFFFNNQVKTILMVKKHILWWSILLPFTLCLSPLIFVVWITLFFYSQEAFAMIFYRPFVLLLLRMGFCIGVKIFVEWMNVLLFTVKQSISHLISSSVSFNSDWENIYFKSLLFEITLVV